MKSPKQSCCFTDVSFPMCVDGKKYCWLQRSYTELLVPLQNSPSLGGSLALVLAAGGPRNMIPIDIRKAETLYI